MKKIHKLYDKIGIYLLSLGIIILNFSLAFDHVVWGDEAYSEMAIRNCDLYGIFQRVYYWDSHPPLYYYFLRLFADLFGYKTPVYHIASLIPFTVGIILACTVLKKLLGSLSATFFILVSGLSESCVEYNLEIRMYSLVFLFVFLCVICSYKILENAQPKSLWILMTVFGVLAAYTHYYGLMICGLIILFTGLYVILIHKRKLWPHALISLSTYIVLYIPWLFVLRFQTQAELNNSWMTAPETLHNILRFITGGHRLYPVVFSLIVFLSIYILIKESGLIGIQRGPAKGSFLISFHKPSVKKWSLELKGITLYWLCIGVLLGFSYAVSFLFHPILAFRYSYVLIPLVLFILMLCVKNILTAYKNTAVTVATYIILLFLLISGLFDFKYFRSVTKTQDYQTSLVLDLVGTPHEDAILCSNGVKHLAWSVLSYYYDNEITTENPTSLDVEPSEFWCFIGYEYEQDLLDEMKAKGYTVSPHLDMWLGKYAVNIYHFYKW